MPLRRIGGLVALLLLASAVGCGETGPGDGNGNGNAATCEPLGDDDADGIRNDHEGCSDEVDTDGDGVLDYVDPDSDNDGVPDAVEAGDQALHTPPPDFDGDGLPDFRDGDSDGDGALDGDEDRNGDGALGLCRATCEPGSTECGPGQTCQTGGVCEPLLTFLCANGETDRLNPDTDDDTLTDAREGTRVCNAPTESNTEGRRLVTLVPLERLVLAVEPTSQTRQATLQNLGEELCANGVDDDGDGAADCEDDRCVNTGDCGAALVTFDVTDGDGPVAGFVVSRAPQGTTVTQELDAVLATLGALLGSEQAFVQQRGHERFTHDDLPTVANTKVALRDLPLQTASGLRNEVARALLGRLPEELGNLPSPTTPGLDVEAADFALGFAVQRRQTEQGLPFVVIIGALGVAAQALDNTLRTGIRIDDVATGTGVGAPDERTDTACEPHLLDPKPSADIIWVIDDSSSMLEERIKVANGATTFFDHALASGYDFRMGVVNVAYNGGGVFCTDTGASGDFFLTDQHVPQFQNCVLEPQGAGPPGIANEYGLTQGYDAVTTHLPRANANDRIRPNAQLVVIYLSDQRAYELTFSCQLDGYTDYEPVDATCLQQVVGPTIDLLQGVSDPEGRGTAYAIVAPVPWSCPSAMESGQGYVEVVEATGGFVDTICADDLDPALERIAADIVRKAEPLVLSHRPISASLSVCKDGEALPRSRAWGFDYHAEDNSLSFVNQDFDPERHSEIVIGYQRWVPDDAQPQ